METILVTGGAGYIGSVTARELQKAGYKVIILDNLSKGHKESIPDEAIFIEADLSDKAATLKALKDYEVDAVMHFAASSYVGESVENPAMYFQNNVSNSITLMNAMAEAGTKYIIFSSSAAVYGDPESVPIKESHPCNPINPYGLSKLFFEQMLRWYESAYNIKSISLRYFNAAGASDIGEDHSPETHLIPIILQVALGQREVIKIFGTSYDTEDRTCIRDYIHVLDLADAHILGLKALTQGHQSDIYNLGNGKGFSVNQIIQKAREITKRNIPSEESDPRPGDPAILIADYSKITKDLGWKPKHDINSIIESAWQWHSSHPDGFSPSEQ